MKQSNSCLSCLLQRYTMSTYNLELPTEIPTVNPIKVLNRATKCSCHNYTRINNRPRLDMTTMTAKFNFVLLQTVTNSQRELLSLLLCIRQIQKGITHCHDRPCYQHNTHMRNQYTRDCCYCIPQTVSHCCQLPRKNQIVTLVTHPVMVITIKKF